MAVATLAATALGAAGVVGLAASPAAAADPGTISGRVTNAAGGAGLSGICVGAYVHGAADQQLIVATATTADGTYTLPGVTAGSVDLRFDATSFCPGGVAGGFVTEWYNNQNTEATATSVVVNPDATTANINASMVLGGSITGHVTAAVGGASLAGICVAALIPGGDDQLVTSIATVANGTYTLTGVPAGSMHVEFFSTGFCPGGTASNYVTQWYNNELTSTSADTVSVAAGATTSNINAALKASGSISGTVTAAAGGAPLAGICVSVYEPFQTGVAPQLITSTSTAADGTYTLPGSPVGPNDVKFYSTGFCPGGTASNYAMQWYNNELIQGSADVVNVSASATTPNINAAMLSGGSMSGRVTAKTGGAGINGACVAAFSTDADPVVVASTGTNPDGTYVLTGIPAGTIRVRFNSQGFCPGGIGSIPGIYDTQWYSGAADFTTAQNVTINLGQTTPNISASMVAVSSFSIKVNGSSTTSTVGFGSTDTLSETGIPSGATGSIVFSSSGHSNLCTITLPATSCTIPAPVAVGSYSPISASFHDTDGGLDDSAATNTVSLVVTAAASVYSIAVNGSASSSIPFGGSVTLSESGINSAATGSVVFNAPGHANLCTITRPATSCVVPGPVAVGSYSPITASFTDTDGNYTSAAATNSASLAVNPANTSFTIAVNGGDNATVSRGAAASLSETGLPSDALGTVTFSTVDNPNLCTITLPATSCDTTLGVGAYTPISASFVDTDGSYGNSSATNSLSLGVAAVSPGAPTAAHATLATGVATITWAAPADDGGAAVSGYTVFVSPGTRTVTVAADATSVVISGLKPGSYTFSVQASNAAGAGAMSTPSNTVTVPKPRAGYWMLGAGGHVYAFGNAVHYGDAPGVAVAMASRRDGLGYWTVDAKGAVHAFGSAAFHGGSPALRAGEAVATISSTPSGKGYWLFTNQGRAFAYGDAHWFGDMAKVHLNGPVVASSATATGKGYYMVGSDGGVFSFGDAKFHGSTGGLHLNKPIVGISPTPDNKGYWLVASDGGVFAFGAPFRGSMGSTKLNKPVNGLVAFGNGYLMVASDGGIFDFSNKPFFGSLAGQGLSAPVIGITAFTTD